MGKLIDLNKVREKVQKKKIIMNIVLAAVALYILYAVYLIIKTPTDTVTVNIGTLTVEESSTGYIIREEAVVKGKNYKNGIYQILAEGEKAAKNQTVFRYYGQNEEEIQQKINEANEKIQKALEKENPFSSTDIRNLDEQIDKQVQYLKTTSDVKKISEFKKQISDIMLKKAKITGENSKSGSYIKKLVSERENYEKKLIEGSEYVVAPQSGIVSYRVDGLENALKVDGIKELTEEKLNNLDIKTGKIIATSTESAKIVNNFESYIVTVLDSNAANQAEIGKNAQLTLASGEEINAEIYYTKKQDDGKILVVFKLNTVTDELISYRKISFNITWWSVSGIKIPNDAILEDENGQKYVQKKTSTGNVKCYIKILKTNDNYSIIGSYSAEDLKALGIDFSTYKGIEVYDTIMLYPKK